MGCITPPPSRRRLGGASTGRRLGSWILVAGKWIWDDMNKPFADGECNYERCGHGYWDVMEDDQNVGGGRIYGEYNKGPVKVGGEWNFDEEDQSVGWYDDQPSHTKPHMPDGNSMGNWINFRL